jgi:hypothetical protein
LRARLRLPGFSRVCSSPGEIGFDDCHVAVNGRCKSFGANSISDVSVTLLMVLPLMFLIVSVNFSGCFQKSPPTIAIGQDLAGGA